MQDAKSQIVRPRPFASRFDPRSRARAQKKMVVCREERKLGDTLILIAT
jgi:hypothetical protein